MTIMKLLTRDVFRGTVLKRNQGICCVPLCSNEAVDAHHILNRNLFTEPEEFGGYFYENGSQLCSSHHLDAELTLITVEELREYCKIIAPAIPSRLDRSLVYDCWGNICVSEWERKAGMLFENEGCQKALKKANKLWLFYETSTSS